MKNNQMSKARSPIRDGLVKPIASRNSIVIGFLLIALTCGLYWPVRKYGFVYDDLLFILGEPSLGLGLSRKGFMWAFSSVHSANWYPLTLISHLLDVQLFGFRAGLHHTVNMLLHAANTYLLFCLLRGLTGVTIGGAIVAALFAVHPLHVESVAWVSERKGLLCAFFFLLTIAAYVRYTRGRTLSRYLLVIPVSALALMSKPMAVTLPFALLLLDYWPLGRLRLGRTDNAGQDPGPRVESLARVVLEKLPLLALAGVSSVITFIAQRSGGALGSSTAYPLPLRIENAVVSYVNYLFKTAWPQDLAALYVFPLQGLPAPRVIFAGIALGCVTAACVWFAQRLPYLATGWFWFLGTLLPAVGFVQVGIQAMADRYTYIPHIGLFVAIVWGLLKIVGNWPPVIKRLSCIGLAAGLTILFLVSREQLSVWESNRTLFEQMLRVDPNNWAAQNELGLQLAEEGKIEEGLAWYRASLRGNPNYSHTHYNLGVALQSLGRLDDAAEEYWKAIRLNGALAEAWYNLGTISRAKGRNAEASTNFSRAVSVKPGFAEPYHGLGAIFLESSNPEQAVKYFEKAVRLSPRNAAFLLDLSRARNAVEQRKRSFH